MPTIYGRPGREPPVTVRRTQVVTAPVEMVRSPRGVALRRRLRLEADIRSRIEPYRMLYWRQGNFRAVHQLENRRDALIDPIRRSFLLPGEPARLSWSQRMQYNQEWRREFPLFTQQYATMPDLLEQIEDMERDPAADQQLLTSLWQQLLAANVPSDSV